MLFTTFNSNFILHQLEAFINIYLPVVITLKVSLVDILLKFNTD